MYEATTTSPTASAWSASTPASASSLIDPLHDPSATGTDVGRDTPGRCGSVPCEASPRPVPASSPRRRSTAVCTSSSDGANSNRPSPASSRMVVSPATSASTSTASRRPTAPSIFTWARDPDTSSTNSRRSIGSAVNRHSTSSGASSNRPPQRVMAKPAASRAEHRVTGYRVRRRPRCSVGRSFAFSDSLLGERAEPE